MIKDVFHLFDTSAEGLDEGDSGREDEGQGKPGLDEFEFASAIKTLGFSSRNHKKLARDLMSKVDTDHDNSISLEEFSSLMEGQLVGRDPDEEINAIFAAFVDYADDGCITKERLAEVAEYIGVKLTDEELNSMFEKTHTTDGFCGIGKEEFVQILKHSTWI
jgi:Ca2+-binding EF-hand superfamily protein